MMPVLPVITDGAEVEGIAVSNVQEWLIHIVFIKQAVHRSITLENKQGDKYIFRGRVIF